MEFSILVIDDNEHDRFFFKKAASGSGLNMKVSEAPDGSVGIELIKNNQYDCIFLDYHLPGMDGLILLKEMKIRNIDIPVIMLTGQKNEQTIVKLIHEGAVDYLSKDSLSAETLRLSIENTQRLYKIKKEKTQMQESLRLSEARLAEAQRIAQIGNWEYDFISHAFYLSKEAYRVLEYGLNRPVPSFFNFSRKIHEDDLFVIRESIKNLKNNPQYDVNFRMYSVDNSIKHIYARGHIVYTNDGKVSKIIGTVQDITVLKNALFETKKANVRSQATSIVFGVAIIVFLLSEAVLDPFVDALSASLLISLSFNGV